MEKLNKLQKGLGITILLVLISSILFAAEEPQRPQRDQRGQGVQRGQRGDRGGFDRAAMESRMMNMMKERMGASDEEWTVIEPRLSKVMELSQDAGGRGGIRGMFGRARGGRGGRGDRSGRDQQRTEITVDSSAVQKATAELQETLEKAEPSTAEIKAKLTALRGVREEAKQELVKSQKQLREVLTLKQEAQLVMMGLLD